VTVTTSPRPLAGLRSAFELWKLAAAVWLLTVVAAAPAVVVVDLEVGGRLRQLTACPAAAADAVLIAVEATLGAVRPLLLATAVGAVALWVGTILWHAGLVSWCGTHGAGPLRLAEILARGALRFWAYARLSGVALLALALGLAGLLTPVGWGIGRAHGAMAERPVLALLGLGAVLALLWTAAVWSATLHGAWRLGFDPGRSALRAFLGGVRETWGRPLPNLGTVALAALVALALALAPLLLGAVVAALRGGPAGTALTLAAAAARAVVWVALLLAFAPATSPAPPSSTTPPSAETDGESG